MTTVIHFVNLIIFCVSFPVDNLSIEAYVSFLYIRFPTYKLRKRKKK